MLTQNIAKKAMIYLFLIVVQLQGFNLFSQKASLDSLIASKQNYSKADTIFVNKLTQEAYRIYDIDIDKTKEYADVAYWISKEINYAVGASESSRLIGIYYHKKAAYDSAMFFYKRAYKIAEDNELKSGIAAALNNIALLSYFNGNYPIALEYYFKCIEIRDELGDSLKLATPYNNIALIYSQQNKPLKALEYFFKSLKIETKIGDTSRLALSFMNIATEYAALDSITQSLKYFNKSINLSIKNKNQLTLTYNYSRIANLYDDLGDYATAHSYHLKGLSIAKQLNAKYEIANALSGIANHYFMQNDFKKAIEYADSAKSIAMQLKIPAVAESATEVLYQSNAMVKKYKRAYENLLLNRALTDSLKNEKNVQLAYELEYEKKLRDSEIEKAKKEATLIRQKFINYLLIIFLIVGMVIILTLYIRIKNKRKINILLTNQKQELNEYKNHLEDKVKERTEDLKEALIKAKESDEMKSMFLRNISHEVRTPMNAIVGYTNMLTSKYSNKPSEKYAKVINEQTMILLNVIEDLVELAGYQTEKNEVTITKIELKELIDEIYEFAINEKTITRKENIVVNLNCDIKKLPDFIETDHIKIRRILTQLVDNALKYTFDGEITIGIDYSKKILAFWVKDTGIGIKPDKISDIFDPFYKIEEKDALFRGTGIGLAIVKHNANLINAKIKVESEPGFGSIFTMELPILKKIHS